MALKLDKVKTTKTSASKGKNYPEVPSTKPLQRKVDSFLDKTEEKKALEGELKILQADLIEAGRPVFVGAVREGNKESSVIVNGDERSVLVSFPNDFRSGADEEEVVGAIGRTKFKKLFNQRVKFTIDGAAIAALDEEKGEEFVEKLAGLFAEFEVSDALSAKEDYVPNSQSELIKELDDEDLEQLEGVYKLPARVAAKK